MITYSNEYVFLLEGVFVFDEERRMYLNPDFDASAAWEEFAKKKGDLSDIYESVNRQIPEFLQDKRSEESIENSAE